MGRSEIRRTLGWTLAGSLTIAAIAAAVAIVTGSFDETEVRVLATSGGLAVFSSTAAAGGGLRSRSAPRLRRLGTFTVAVSAATFLVLIAAIWVDEESEGLWRIFGCGALASVAAAHASLVTGARRPSDSGLVASVATLSVVLGVADATLTALPVAGVVDEIGDGAAEILAVLVIGLLLTSAIPPILRRTQPQPAAPAETPAESLRERVLAATARIEDLTRDPGDRRVEIRRELERLRSAARSLPPEG